MSGRERASAIEEQAARWVARLDREGRTAELVAQLETWLHGDSRRRGALLQAEAAWLLLDAAGPAASRPEPGRRLRFAGRRLLQGGVAAALAAGVAAVLVLTPRGDSYVTAVGEIRSIPLSDRSIAAINTSSRIEVAFEPHRRRVRLDQGEVFFKVAKDRTRPFVVEAGDVRVEAVGTAFSVRRRADGADVLVTEGVVRAWTVGAEDRAVRIASGARAFVTDDAVAVTTPAPSAISRQLAWRAGQIELAGETLADAVIELNRYNDRKISVRDAAVGSRRLYGVYHTDDPEGFAKAAALSLGAHAYSNGEGIVIDAGH